MPNGLVCSRIARGHVQNMVEDDVVDQKEDKHRRCSQHGFDPLVEESMCMCVNKDNEFRLYASVGVVS